ncbi:MAG TPA: hypothetical protein PKJ26_02945 [Candidatus Woesebacteria bacterium]|nr:hypothetical protein [Candidatus Woesebacteria bacterium]HNS65427.1 hypothetical protein [Candidatus Woesebacteria bacterium]
MTENGNPVVGLEAQLANSAGAEVAAGAGPEDLTKVTLKRPEDPALVRLLENKLREYNQRIAERLKDDAYQAPEEADFDLRYRVDILDNVLGLRNGESISVDQAINSVRAKHGGVFNPDQFNNAFGVVRNYIEHAGQGNDGGTGLSEYGSAKARNIAEAASKIKGAAEQRAQERQDRITQRKGRWGERFAKFKDAGKKAWEKVGQLKDAAGNKAKDAVRETGQMIVDSPIVAKVDLIQAGARAEAAKLGAKLVDTADRVTTGVAEKIDATGMKVEEYKAASKAKAAEVVVDSLRGAVSKVRAGMDAVDKQLMKIDAAGEVAEDGPTPIVNRLEEKAQEQRQKQEDATKRERSVRGLRGWLRRLGA